MRQRLIMLDLIAIPLILVTACGGITDADRRDTDPSPPMPGPIATPPADADVSSGAQSATLLQRHGVIVLLHAGTGRDGGTLDANVVENTLCSAPPLADVGRVLALITPPGTIRPAVTVLLPRGDDYLYHAHGDCFPTPGTWQVAIVVQPRGNGADMCWDFTFTKPDAA
jgi:hypothetical protein